MNRFEKIVNSQFSAFMNYLYKILVINILFLITSFIGLIFFTIAPATIASMVCLKGVAEKKEFPIFRSFLQIFKTEYKKSMGFFVYYILVYSILAFAFYYYLHTEDSIIYTIGLLVSGGLIIINLLSLIHFILISIYTPKISFRKKLKYSYLMIVYAPIVSLSLLIVNVSSMIFAYVFITFSFMFTFAFIGVFNISISKNTYLKLTKEHEPLQVLDY